MNLAKENKIRAWRLSRRQVQAAFSEFGAVTKHEIAVAITKQFPELVPFMPRYRKAWMSEDHQSQVFDAVGFAMDIFRPN